MADENPRLIIIQPYLNIALGYEKKKEFNMGIVESYFFKCKCGYKVKLNQGSYLCSDENGETCYLFTNICHCKKCGHIGEFSTEEDRKCPIFGSKIKLAIPILFIIFPKLSKYLLSLKCPKCGKKHLKLQTDNFHF